MTLSVNATVQKNHKGILAPNLPCLRLKVDDYLMLKEPFIAPQKTPFEPHSLMLSTSSWEDVPEQYKSDSPFFTTIFFIYCKTNRDVLS